MVLNVSAGRLWLRRWRICSTGIATCSGSKRCQLARLMTWKLFTTQTSWPNCQKRTRARATGVPAGVLFRRRVRDRFRSGGESAIVLRCRANFCLTPGRECGCSMATPSVFESFENQPSCSEGSTSASAMRFPISLKSSIRSASISTFDRKEPRFCFES